MKHANCNDWPPWLCCRSPDVQTQKPNLSPVAEGMSIPNARSSAKTITSCVRTRAISARLSPASGETSHKARHVPEPGGQPTNLILQLTLLGVVHRGFVARAPHIGFICADARHR